MWFAHVGNYNNATELYLFGETREQVVNLLVAEVRKSLEAEIASFQEDLQGYVDWTPSTDSGTRERDMNIVEFRGLIQQCREPLLVLNRTTPYDEETWTIITDDFSNRDMSFFIGEVKQLPARVEA